MNTATATEGVRTIEASKGAHVVPQKVLQQGAKLIRSLRPPNGLEQRDQEIVVINLRNRVNYGAYPEWRQLMIMVEAHAARSGMSTVEVIGQIVDYLFEQLGPVKAS